MSYGVSYSTNSSTILLLCRVSYSLCNVGNVSVDVGLFGGLNGAGGGYQSQVAALVSVDLKGPVADDLHDPPSNLPAPRSQPCSAPSPSSREACRADHRCWQIPSPRSRRLAVAATYRSTRYPAPGSGRHRGTAGSTEWRVRCTQSVVRTRPCFRVDTAVRTRPW